MVVLGLILVALAVAAAAGVLMGNTAPASLEIFSRPVPGLTAAEVFLAGVVVCAVFMFGFMLIASGIRRSRMRHRELVELRGEHDDTLDSLRYEKEQLERQLMQARGGMAPAPGMGAGPGPGGGPGAGPGMGPGGGPGSVPGPGPGDLRGPDPRGADPRTDPFMGDPFTDPRGGEPQDGGFWGGPPQGGPGPDGPSGRGSHPGTGINSDVRVAPSSRTYEELSPDSDYRY